MTIYTSNDREKVMELVEKYDIDYIYVGLTETVNGCDQGSAESGPEFGYVKGLWGRKTNLDHEFLKSLGTVVFDLGNCTYNAYSYDTKSWETTEYPCYIVKVNRNK